MPERTYTSTGDGKIEALQEPPFPTEDELQALIGDYLRIPVKPITESGVKPITQSGQADHLIIDQDAVPSLAEVKRGSNPEIRPTIVGQLLELEYVAHASETWTAEELRGAFERQVEARGRDAEAELATLRQTDGDPDVDGFWEDVSNSALDISLGSGKDSPWRL